jgi:hypothetical protein
MKKFILSIIILVASSAANAQTLDPLRENAQKYELIATSRLLITIALFAAAILIFIKLILDYSLKNKLIENGASEAIVSKLLQTDKKHDKRVTIKWVTILAGTGIGLLLVYAFLPLGVHSLAIMSLSLAVSFLCYYFFIKDLEK